MTTALLSERDLTDLLVATPGNPERKRQAGEAFRALQSGTLDSERAKALATVEGKDFLRKYSQNFGVNALRDRLEPIPGLRLPVGDAAHVLGAFAKQLPSLSFPRLRVPPLPLPQVQAYELAKSTIAGMGLPTNVPITLPRELTPEAVIDAAYATGKKYAENVIEAKTGVPISLPTKLTAKEIERSLIGWIPDDAAAALETGLTLAAQYAASAVSAAVTSALVGAGIGSIVPGLGTIVGVGVALLIGAIKDEIKGALGPTPSSFERPCTTKVTCPTVPKLSPIELLPWLLTEHARVSGALAVERQREFCGRGAIIDCVERLGFLIDVAFEASRTTPQVLGREQAARLAKAFQSAPATYMWFDYGTIQPGGTFANASNTIVQVPNRERELMLEALFERLQVLDKLGSRVGMVDTLPPSDLGALRFALVTELQFAAVQYQNTESEEAQRWLQKVGDWFGQYLKREDAEYAASVAMSQQADPRGSAVMWTARGGACNIRVGEPAPACVSDVPGYVGPPAGVVITGRAADGRWLTSTDTTLSITKMLGPTPSAFVLAGFAAQLNGWLAQNPQYADCVTPTERSLWLNLSVAVHNGRVQLHEAIATWNSTIFHKCGLRYKPGTHDLWAALKTGFSRGTNPLEQRFKPERVFSPVNPARWFQGG